MVVKVQLSLHNIAIHLNVLEIHSCLYYIHGVLKQNNE